MKLKDILTTNPRVIGPNAIICEAARLMNDYDIGMLPVCDGNNLVGAITDRDLATRAVAQGCDPLKTRVRDVMTPGIVYCYEDQELDEVAEIMERKQIRRIVVLNRDKRLIGIASMGDFAVRSKGEHLAEEMLECVCQPA